jgi:hypothetical protein
VRRHSDPQRDDRLEAAEVSPCDVRLRLYNDSVCDYERKRKNKKKESGRGTQDRGNREKERERSRDELVIRLGDLELVAHFGGHELIFQEKLINRFFLEEQIKYGPA